MKIFSTRKSKLKNFSSEYEFQFFNKMLDDEYFGQQFEQLYKAHVSLFDRIFVTGGTDLEFTLAFIYNALGQKISEPVEGKPNCRRYRLAYVEDYYRLHKYYYKKKPTTFQSYELDMTKLYTTNLNIYEHSISRNQ